MTLILENLVVTQSGSPMIRLDLSIAPGEVVTIMGPSGAGKSTLLMGLIGALPPAFTLSGKIWLNGTEITNLPTRARQLGILFQDDILFPHLSVGANLGFGLPRRTVDRAGHIAQALREAGMEGLESRDPATLSGGQRARVALMRALLSQPRALLLDEPFSKLDTARRARLREFVFTTARTRALPVIMVTHDPDDARAAAGPVLDVQGNALDV